MKIKYIICPKHDEILGTHIPFEIVDVIKIYSTYWLLIKIFGIISEYNKELIQYIFDFNKFLMISL